MPTQRIKNYLILDVISSQGATSIVYRALDEAIGRVVALKVARRNVAIDASRFKQEAEALAKIDHQNVCKVWNVEVSIPGIAMELVNGESLSRVIKANATQNTWLQWEKAVRYVQQAAAGLREAHRVDVTHRDVKPSNLIRKPTDQIKLVDFGFCRLSGDKAHADSPTKYGTPAYMSPEQVSGDSVDALSDIWSLGVSFFELLTNRCPFEVDQELKVPIHTEPAPRLDKFRKDLPESLESIVKKMLTPDRGSRYQHVDDVLRDLAALGLRPRSDQRPSFFDASVLMPILQRPYASSYAGDPAGMRRVELANMAWDSRRESVSSSPLAILELLERTSEILWNSRSRAIDDPNCAFVYHAARGLKPEGAESDLDPYDLEWNDLPHSLRQAFFHRCLPFCRKKIEDLVRQLIPPERQCRFSASIFMKLLAEHHVTPREALFVTEAHGCDSSEFWTEEKAYSDQAATIKREADIEVCILGDSLDPPSPTDEASTITMK